MLAWSMEISLYCLIYRPRTTIKAQTIPDFIAECLFSTVEEEQNKALSVSEERGMESIPEHEFVWNLFVDGASGSTGSEAGILLKGPDGFKVCYALHFGFLASNNMAKYEALLNGMQIALEVGATDLRINNDSQLVVNKIKGVH